MKIKGKYGIGNLLKIIIKIGIVIGSLCLVFFYPLLEMFNISLDWFLIMVYPCGICFLLFANQISHLFKSLEENNPFTNITVNHLRKSMYLSFGISLLVLISFIIIICFYSSYTLGIKLCILFISILFLGIGISLYILKELFKEAINYKEENDLTI